MNVLFNLVSYYNLTTENNDVFHKCAGNLLKNLHDINSYTCNELADICFVSPSTLIRLCKKLGYNSFSAFKTDTSNIIASFPYADGSFPIHITPSKYLDYISELINNVRKEVNIDYLENVANAIHNHKDIFIFSGFSSQNLDYFQINLFLDGHFVEWFTRLKDSGNAVKRITENSFVIVLRIESSAATDTDKIIKYAKNHGAEVLLITNKRNPLMIPFIDYILAFESNTESGIDTIGIDILLACLICKYKELYTQ